MRTFTLPDQNCEILLIPCQEFLLIKKLNDMSGFPFDWETLGSGSPSGISFVSNQAQVWNLFKIKQRAVKT